MLSANRLTIAGLAVLALAMTSAVLLITHILFGGLTAGVTGAIGLLAFALLRYAVPLRRRSEHGDRQ